jgi:hypothetical protein
VDEGDRLVVLRFHPDSASVVLREEGRKVAAEWGLVERGVTDAPDDVSGDTSVTRWRSDNRRWSASMRYGRLGAAPTIITVADEEAVERIAGAGPLARLVLQVNRLVDADEVEYTADLMRLATNPPVDDSSFTPTARRAGPELPLCEPVVAELPAPGTSTRDALTPAVASLLEAAVASAYPGWRLILGEGTWITDPSGRPERVFLGPLSFDSPDPMRLFTVHLPARAAVSNARARDLRPENHCHARADIVIARHWADGSFRDARRIAVEDEALGTEITEIDSPAMIDSADVALLGVQYAATYATERWSGGVIWQAAIIADSAAGGLRIPMSYAFDAVEEATRKRGLIVVTGHPQGALEVTTLEQNAWGVATRTVVVPLDSSGALSGTTLLDKLF